MCSSCNSAGCGCPSFDLSKPVQLSDGREVRIIATNALPAGYSATGPIIALCKISSKTEEVRRYNVDGTSNISGWPSLVNIPETVEKFLNIYKGRSVRTAGKQDTLSSARLYAHGNRDDHEGTVKLVYTDGKLTGVELVKCD